MLYPNSFGRKTPVLSPQCFASRNAHHEPHETVASFQSAIQFFGLNSNGYEKILAHSLQLNSGVAEKQIMVYTCLDFGSNQGLAQMESLPIFGKRFDYVRLNRIERCAF